MNTLNISVENNMVVSRYNGEGEGTKLCGFVSDKQVQDLVNNHNKSEEISPSRRNAKAVRGA
jgi:hypothetical protein